MVSQDVYLLFLVINLVFRIILDQVQYRIDVAFSTEFKKGMTSSFFRICPEIGFLGRGREDVEGSLFSTFVPYCAEDLLLTRAGEGRYILRTVRALSYGGAIKEAFPERY